MIMQIHLNSFICMEKIDNKTFSMLNSYLFNYYFDM